MPTEEIVNYEMSGPKKVTLWTDTEMAHAMGMSREAFLDALTSGKWGLSYHVKRGDGYVFTQKILEDNCKRASCVRAGRHLKPQKFRDGKHKCLRCDHTWEEK